MIPFGSIFERAKVQLEIETPSHLQRLGRLGDGVFVALESARMVAGRRAIYRVRGASMCPTLEDGDHVIVDTRVASLPPIGCIVVAREPGGERVLVKRVRSHGTDTVALGSDDPTQGRDSRHFGSVPRSHIIGRVTVAFRT